MKVLGRNHQLARHDPLGKDLAGPVDVVQECFKCPHPLRHTQLDDRPLDGGYHPWNQVQGEGSLLARE